MSNSTTRFGLFTLPSNYVEFTKFGKKHGEARGFQKRTVPAVVVIVLTAMVLYVRFPYIPWVETVLIPLLFAVAIIVTIALAFMYYRPFAAAQVSITYCAILTMVGLAIAIGGSILDWIFLPMQWLGNR